MRKTVVSGVLGLVSLFGATCASAYSISTTPLSSVTGLSAGDMFDLSIDASSDFPENFGGGVLVSWDAGLSLLTTDAEIIAEAESGVFNFVSSRTDVSLNQTDIRPTKISGGPIPAGGFHIATLTFQVGPTPTFPLNVSLGPVPLNDWVDGSFVNLDPQPDYFGTTVTGATAVPLPGAVWLFGAGLVGMIGVARRRSGSAA